MASAVAQTGTNGAGASGDSPEPRAPCTDAASSLEVRVNDRVFRVSAADPEALYEELREQVASAWNFARETVKLIAQGRVLRTGDALLAAVQKQQPLRVIGTASLALERVQLARPDPLVRPADFDGPGRRPARPFDGELYPRAPVGSCSRWGFSELRVLGNFADANQAHSLLEQLARDPGVNYVMQKWHWRVGALCEMAPDGRVGVDPVCVLGLNQGRGAVIYLRLRTDDLAGFRRYDAIREVLAHELAHNEHAEHDSRFYKLMREILSEMNRRDWRRLKGFRLGSGNAGAR
jgi:hypothetical protein